MWLEKVEVIPSPKIRQDQSEKKRIELHVHSKMSAMDGIGSISEYIERAAYWGHQAIAVTDHGNVQIISRGTNSKSET